MATIVRIISRLNVGGPAIHTILLTDGLNRLGHRDILVAGRVSASEGDMRYLADEKGVRPVVIPELGREIDAKNDAIAVTPSTIPVNTLWIAGHATFTRNEATASTTARNASKCWYA